MMAAKISGFSTLQTYSSLFVTVTKSEPKNTPDTPSMANRRLASGELNPSLAESKLLEPVCASFLYLSMRATSGLAEVQANTSVFHKPEKTACLLVHAAMQYAPTGEADLAIRGSLV